MHFLGSSTARVRVLVAGALAGGLLLPASVIYAAPSATPTGTLTGTVTCGPSEDAPASNAMIAVEGINLNTHSDAAGKFTLIGLPASQTFTIDALADPQGSVTST